MFVFAAPVLYVVYAVIQGLSFGMADIIHLRLHSFGNIELATRIPMAVSAGLVGDIINFLICCVVFFVIGYFVAYFLIKKLNLATPGRMGNYIDDEAGEDTPAEAQAKTSKVSDQGKTSDSEKSQAAKIIDLLGGKDNIVEVDACMTRLRVTVKDESLVADAPSWKELGALGLIKKNNGIQAVYGPKADIIKADVLDLL